MRSLALSVSALLIVGFAGSGHSEETERYRIEKTDKGYVRMDTRTCEESAGQLVCRIAADERLALQEEIERLQIKLEALDARVAKLEALPAIPRALVPSDEEIDKSLDAMEKFFHRFMGIVKELDKDNEQRT